MADTRDRIVEEARDLYLKGGLTAVSMRKVANRVGVSATALYRHFDNKEALLVAVVQAGFERFTTYLLRGLAGKSPLARLELTGESYLHFALENSSYYRIMFMTSMEDFGFDELPESNRETLGHSFQLLVNRVRECQDTGLLRAGDARELAVVIWAFSHGFASLYLSGHLGPLSGKPVAFARFYAAAQTEFVAGLHP